MVIARGTTLVQVGSYLYKVEKDKPITPLLHVQFLPPDYQHLIASSLLMYHYIQDTAKALESAIEYLEDLKTDDVYRAIPALVSMVSAAGLVEASVKYGPDTVNAKITKK